MNSTSESKQVVFTTWGSFGDIHPFMGLALEMKARLTSESVPKMSRCECEVRTAHGQRAM